MIQQAGGNLCCLFSPQHGFYAEKQANMRESSNAWSEIWGVPIFSLYGKSRQPTAEMLNQIDVLLVDLQDVGTRVYTFGTTVGLCLEAACRLGIKVVILDRPNPIGGKWLEGNLVQAQYRSFVGRYPLPMRHGLTLAEMARFVVGELHLDCDLEVVALEGWSRDALFPDCSLPWVFPSPNMPCWETALLYPGMVLLEGTNISEGRGTTLPFQMFGAPFIDQQSLWQCMERHDLEGAVLRPVCFEPVFDKWQGELCYGFQIHVTDHRRLSPYRLGLSLLQALLQTHPEHFSWLPPPYEYETEKLPIDILIGSRELRELLESGTDIRELETGWADELKAYEERLDSYLLYHDGSL